MTKVTELGHYSVETTLAVVGGKWKPADPLAVLRLGFEARSVYGWKRRAAFGESPGDFFTKANGRGDRLGLGSAAL